MLYAVIMAGGRGKRFWPRSRFKKPKQVLKIVDPARTMIEITIDRLKPIIGIDKTKIVTNKKQIGIIKSSVPYLTDKNFIAEPLMKDTAACIGLSAVLLEKEDPDAVMLVIPADHVIKNEKKFLSTVEAAYKFVEKEESLITFGIKPKFPGTGFGYIEIKENSKRCFKGKNIFKTRRFTEKPPKVEAKKFFEKGSYYWNSGMFLWKAKSILKTFKKFMPELHEALLNIKKISESAGFDKKLEKIYADLSKISIDYGIMEPAVLSKSKDILNVYTMVSEFGWDDVGSWKNMENVFKKDKSGNITVGDNAVLDTKNCIIISNDGSAEKHLIGTIDLENIIIIHTKDATLVCRKDSAQKVKKLVSLIEEKSLDRYL